MLIQNYILLKKKKNYGTVKCMIINTMVFIKYKKKCKILNRTKVIVLVKSSYDILYHILTLNHFYYCLDCSSPLHARILYI